MTREQIDNLVAGNNFPERNGPKTLVETHISWVIIGDQFVYKIKKPMKYSFLDFSTLALRKYFCEREIKLNRRFTRDIYLAVEPVREYAQSIRLGGEDGSIIDYAVKMKKLDEGKRMDKLLAAQMVTPTHIKALAQKVAAFHKTAEIIYQKDILAMEKDYNDLETVKEFLGVEIGQEYSGLIQKATTFSDRFLKQHNSLLVKRREKGFYRDGHGDLHTRNIFLLPEPVPFDCIEFNDDFRQQDVLNEVAFLCMDLDAFEQRKLSDLFLESYNIAFPAISTSEERALFVYYKSYRANIRAKVNSLRAQSASDKREKKKALEAAQQYLSLMHGYLEEINS